MNDTLHSAATMAVIAMYGSVWLMDPAAAESYLNTLDGMDLSAHVAEFAGRRTEATGADRNAFVAADGIAMFEIDGPMTKKPTSMMDVFGGTSTLMLRKQIRAARSDDDVKAAVVVIHSPGGEAFGVSDLGEDIAAFAAMKPIIAFIPDCCASAAYWAASQCSAIVCGPGGWAGCIGTVSGLVDSTRRYESMGHKVYRFTNKEATVKGAGMAGAPITEAMLAEKQRETDTWNGLFVSAIARGRGMDEDDVRSMATGQMFDAADALQRGLIDAIMSFDDVITSVKSGEWPDSMTITAKAGGEDTVNMALKDLVAAMLGRAKSDDEKAVAAQLETELAAKEATEAENAKLRAQLAAAQALTAQANTDLAGTEARSYALGLCASGKLTAAEANDVVDNYMQSQADDAKDGGKRLDKLKGFLEKRPVTALQTAVIETAASATDTDTEKTLKVLLSREATPENTNRGDHQGLDKPDTDGVHLTHKTMSAADRETAVKRAKAQAGGN